MDATLAGAVCSTGPSTARNMSYPDKISNDRHVEALLGFDGTIYRFAGGYEISLRIRRVDASGEVPHGFEYSFVLRGPGADCKPGGRILAYDNAHAPKNAKGANDHMHQTRRGVGGARIGVQRGTAIRVNTIDELIGRFLDECYATLIELGVEVDAPVATTTAQRERKSARMRKKGFR